MELKPCPFCGGEAKIATTVSKSVPSKPRCYVYCEKCFTATQYFNDEKYDGGFIDKAAEAWNRRAEPNMVEIDQFSRVGEGEKE